MESNELPDTPNDEKSDDEVTDMDELNKTEDIDESIEDKKE